MSCDATITSPNRVAFIAHTEASVGDGKGKQAIIKRVRNNALPTVGGYKS